MKLTDEFSVTSKLLTFDNYNSITHTQQRTGNMNDFVYFQ